MLESIDPDEAFGEMRSILAAPKPDAYGLVKLERLAQRMLVGAPDAFFAEWAPYLDAYSGKFGGVLEIPVSSIDIELGDAERLPELGDWRRLFAYKLHIMDPSDLAYIDAGRGLEKITALAAHMGEGDASVIAKIMALPGLEGVTRLSLSDNELDDSGLAAFISHCSWPLTSLDLSHNKLQGASIAMMAATDWVAGLTSLSLRGNIFEEGLVEFLLDAPLDHLQTFHSGYMLAEKAELAKAFASLANTSSLRDLDLGGCPIGDDGLAILFQADLPETLERFEAYYAELTDRGVALLADCEALHRLKALDLMGNAITDQGAQTLARTTYLPSLEWLRLYSNQITREGADAILASTSLTNLEVLEWERQERSM